MNSLVVFCYDTENEAAAALKHVASQKQENVKKPLVAISDAAVAFKKDNGKVKIRQTMEAAVKGSNTFGGGLWGLLIGFLFGGPLLGAALGLVVGQLTGMRLDLGIDNDFIDSIGDELKPGNSALLLLVDDAEPETIAEAMGDHAGTLLHTSLSPDAAKILTEASDHEHIRDAVEAEHLHEN